MNAVPVPKPMPMTVGEFLDMPGDGTDTRYDLIGGEPVTQAQPAENHSEIQGSLTTLLNMALRDRPPCRAITEVGIYKTRRHFNSRGADIVVTCQRRRSRDEPVTPIVVIEILSPSNRAETMAKLSFFSTFDSIQEIVLVESESIGVTVYRRGPGDWFDFPTATLKEGQDLVLSSIDVSIPLSEIYRNVPF